MTTPWSRRTPLGGWIYSPVACHTGAPHGQPCGKQLRAQACGTFTRDFSVFFSDVAALDAPELLPSGSVRALDLDINHSRLLVANVSREWQSA